jgi:hypothetical protein
MASSPSTCGVCDVRHISKSSEVWCPECDQGFCIDCTGYHSLSNASHNERFILYCKKHGFPCCRICIAEDHNECKDLSVLENIVKNVKNSHEFNETERLIDEMMEYIHKIRQNRENNSGTITEQKRIIENEIRKLRGKKSIIILTSYKKIC